MIDFYLLFDKLVYVKNLFLRREVYVVPFLSNDDYIFHFLTNDRTIKDNKLCGDFIRVTPRRIRKHFGFIGPVISRNEASFFKESRKNHTDHFAVAVKNCLAKKCVGVVRIKKSTFLNLKLQIDFEQPPGGHLNVIGWPENTKDQPKSKYLELLMKIKNVIQNDSGHLIQFNPPVTRVS